MKKDKIEKSDKMLEKYRHSLAHIMAFAIKKIFKKVSFGVGPSIENGFYYDVLVNKPITEETLMMIEEKMKEIISKGFTFYKKEVTLNEAIKLFKELKQDFKIELLEDLKKYGTTEKWEIEAIVVKEAKKKPVVKNVSIYILGEIKKDFTLKDLIKNQENVFVDLCRGPHIKSTKEINPESFKLIDVSGAYFRGDEKNKMLTRVYGVAFKTGKDLTEYLEKLAEAKKRDHNKIGRELGYFTTVDYIGQGLPILMPKGAKVLQILQRFVEDEEERRGYLLVRTPLLAKSDLYKISGHWDHYKESMFVIGDEKKDKEVFALRPMTCPFQFQVFLNKTRSYRDLPMRFNESATMFRNEASGEMHGLIRVRQFTISEGHVACRADQVEEEFEGCVELAVFMMKKLGIYKDTTYRFSKWDKRNKEKYIGTQKQWNEAQDLMKKILDKLELTYEEMEGEAAFYGPKLDIQMKNVFGKEDTIITIQLDFQLAERFGMEYIDKDGGKKYPYIIHRTSVGCYERSLALLLEKYAGALPLWIAPVQVAILPVSEKSVEYAKNIYNNLKLKNIRTDLLIENETLGKRIREAEMQKIPYIVIIGQKEEEHNIISVRERKIGDIGNFSLVDFIVKLEKEITEKEIKE